MASSSLFCQLYTPRMWRCKIRNIGSRRWIRRWEARFLGISAHHPAPAAVDSFRPGSRTIILRGRWRGEPRQRLAVIPGHPRRWITLQRRGMPLQLGQIIERIGSVQLAGVDQTHEQIADSGAVHRLVEERVLAVQNRLL